MFVHALIQTSNAFVRLALIGFDPKRNTENPVKPTANPKGDVDGLIVIVMIPGLEPNIIHSTCVEKKICYS